MTENATCEHGKPIDHWCEECLPLVAWEVEVDTYSSVVFAPTAPKARWIAVKEYWAAGYGRGPGNWPPGVSAWRCPSLDSSTLRDKGPRAWNPSYAKEMQ